jgi:hypothetical protein
LKIIKIQFKLEKEFAPVYLLTAAKHAEFDRLNNERMELLARLHEMLDADHQL